MDGYTAALSSLVKWITVTMAVFIPLGMWKLVEIIIYVSQLF